MTRPRLRHAVTALFCIGLLYGCVGTPNVDVYLVDIKPLPSTLFEQRAELKLRIQNLTESEIRGDGMDLKLIVNDRKLARGVSDADFAVPPLADTMVSIVVSSSVFDTLRQLLSLSTRETFNYGMYGTVFAPGINKRFSRQGEFTRADLNRLVQPPAQ